jgi:PhnB protein
MKFIPYLSFNGNAEEALEFYAKTFNGTINRIMRYSEIPNEENTPQIPEDYKNKVLHSELNIGNVIIYLSDTFPGMNVNYGNSISININPDNEEELRTIFTKLSSGGNVETPVDKMFWGSIFGSLTDKFGISWSLDYELKSK